MFSYNIISALTESFSCCTAYFQSLPHFPLDAHSRVHPPFPGNTPSHHLPTTRFRTCRSIKQHDFTFAVLSSNAFYRHLPTTRFQPLFYQRPFALRRPSTPAFCRVFSNDPQSAFLTERQNVPIYCPFLSDPQSAVPLVRRQTLSKPQFTLTAIFPGRQNVPLISIFEHDCNQLKTSKNCRFVVSFRATRSRLFHPGVKMCRFIVRFQAR